MLSSPLLLFLLLRTGPTTGEAVLLEGGMAAGPVGGWGLEALTLVLAQPLQEVQGILDASVCSSSSTSVRFTISWLSSPQQVAS